MPESSAFLKPEVLARITPLGLRAQRVVEGTISGLHRSPMHGVSVEFADHREYAPGDDLKRLDWRAFARTGRYFIKRYEEESNLRCTILLDASASMRYRGKSGMSKFEYAATIAASLATMLVRQRDAVGLALFDREQRAFLRPVATQAHLAKIIDVLEKAKPDRTTDLGGVMGQVVEQVPGRGMVVVISDLLVDLDAFYHSLGRMQHRGHEVLVFQVLHPDEIELPFDDAVLFKDMEGVEEIQAEPWAFRKAYRAAIQSFTDDVTRRCRSSGIDHLLMRTSDDLGHALSYYLHQRQRLATAKRGGKISAHTPAPGSPGDGGSAR